MSAARRKSGERRLQLEATVSLRVSRGQVELSHGQGTTRRLLRLNDPRLVRWLLAFADPRTESSGAALAQRLLALESAGARRLVARFRAERILAPPARPSARRLALERQWILRGWRDALDLHQASLGSAPLAELPEGTAQEPAPARAAPRRAGDVPLAVRAKPSARTAGSALRARRTVRRFARRPLAFGTFSELVSRSFVHPVHRAPYGRVFVVALAVAGVPAGLYEYLPREERLALRRAGDWAQTLQRVGSGQGALRSASAAFLHCLVWPALARAAACGRYLSAFIEAGRGAQVHLLCAAGLGLGAFMTASVSDSEAAAFLGLPEDGSQSAVYLTAVG